MHDNLLLYLNIYLNVDLLEYAHLRYIFWLLFQKQLSVFCSVLEPYDFTIDATSGEIETTACIDRESSPYQGGQIDIIVRAENTRVTPILQTEATVHIMIGDQNDNDPYFEQDSYSVLLGSLPPNTDLITVTAKDDDVVCRSRNVNFLRYT